MRALFTVQPATGHLQPMLPVAKALEEGGHEVAFCSSALFRAALAPHGFEYFEAGLDWQASDRSTWTYFPPMPPPLTPEFPAFVVTLFGDVTTQAMVPDLIRIAEEWVPDIIVRESMELGGCIAAERLGIPHASLGGNAYSGVDSPELNYFPGNRQLAAEPLARHLAMFGLPADPEMRILFRNLHMCFMASEWDRSGIPAPENTRHMRHVNSPRPGETLPDWVGDLSDRPVVLAALGTIAHATPGVLSAIIEGLSNEEIELIVAIGEGQDPGAFGPQPANVHLEPYVPQTLLLPRCDAFINHGGFNSVKEGLACGVPLVVVPIMSDEPYSAERCAALGVGRVVEPDNRSPEAFREATLDVLADASYGAEASAMQEKMMALPGTAEVVQLLEGLAHSGARQGETSGSVPFG